MSKSALQQITDQHTADDVFCDAEVLKFRRNSLTACLKSRNINFIELTESVYYKDLMPDIFNGNEATAQYLIQDAANITEVITIIAH